MKNTILGLVTLSTIACTTATPPPKQAKTQPDARFVARQRAIAQMNRNFSRVHFGFDSVELSKQTSEALAQNVELMRRFPALQLEVQGHCDSRGSTEYNLALGQRRAEIIRRYMITAGVRSARISTISFGEELPLASAYAYNRRAEFRVTVASATPRKGAVRGTVASGGAFTTTTLARSW